MNIHFDNFNIDDLVSNGAKQRIKKYLRTEIKDNDSIMNQLNENTNYLISNFFKQDNEYNLDLTYITDDDNIHISLIKINKHELEIEAKREKIRENIKNMDNNKGLGYTMNKEKDVNNNNFKLDKRVTSEMINAYDIARKKFGEELPNPQVILNDKDKHIKMFMEYITLVLEKTKSEVELMHILDNEYSNYIGIVTKFDYKQIFQMIKKNINNDENDAPHFDILDEE